MFEIGFSELLIVAVVALIVLGPERLPRAAQMVGLWVRKARAQWFSMKSELERELAADEMTRSLRESGRQVERDLRETSDATRDALSARPAASGKDANSRPEQHPGVGDADDGDNDNKRKPAP